MSTDLIDARPITDPMLRHLFPRLTPARERGSALFAALVGEARAEHWFVEGEVPDSLDGRFAILATVVALATVRLDAGDAAGREASVALTERFIEAMDVEHREMGLGDPTLGKKYVAFKDPDRIAWEFYMA